MAPPASRTRSRPPCPLPRGGSHHWHRPGRLVRHPLRKPDATTTGVKAGSTLTRHDGDVTVDGTVLANLDIHGFVIVKAKNVTISNSIVRGGQAQGFATGLITDYGYAGRLITDVTIEPEFPSVWFDGIKRSGYTARRVHVIGGVDEGPRRQRHHRGLPAREHHLLRLRPQQSGGPTHNDNVQIQNGQNIKVTGNTIRGSQNFAMLGAASKGNLKPGRQGQLLDGGHCTVKLQILSGWTETATVTGNKFGPNRNVSSCAFTAYPAVSLTHSNNTFEATGGIVTPLLVVS